MFGMHVSAKKFGKDLYKEINEDNVSNGAAALAYYITLALFPAMIFLLSVLPYLPIANLQQALMDFIAQALPGDASKLLSDTLNGIMSTRTTGLVSFGALATIWAASAGMVAVIQQLNITYDVEETRSMFKVRGLAILMTFGLGLLMVAAFALIVLGGVLQNYLETHFGFGDSVLTLFAILRWVIIACAILLAFALTYYFGPNVEQKFQFITPGSVFGTVVIALASLLFKYYVENFGSYNATYGTLGAVIILMLWLYIGGLVLLLGSEVNALAEHYSPEGKEKGEKLQPESKGLPPYREPSPVH
jgi:membrane protein